MARWKELWSILMEFLKSSGRAASRRLEKVRAGEDFQMLWCTSAHCRVPGAEPGTPAHLTESIFCIVSVVLFDTD